MGPYYPPPSPMSHCPATLPPTPYRLPPGPQIPHYHLEEATEACKPVMGPYYREPVKSPGPLPTHLIEPLIRSFRDDTYVEDEGSIVYYKARYAV